MNILHLNPFFYPYKGGTEQYIYDLGKRQAKKHNVTVVTSRYQSNKPHEVMDGMKIHRLRSIVLKRLPNIFPPPYSITPAFTHQIRKIIHDEKPDIINLHNRFCVDYYSLMMLKKALKIPLFLTIHNAKPVGISKTIDTLGSVYDRTGGSFIIKHSDWIIANSKWSQRVTIPQDLLKKSEVIYNGIDTSVYKPKKSSFRKKFDAENISLTVSRLVPQKGLSYLIQALQYVDHDYKAVIYGKGPESTKLEKLAHELDVRDKVVFTGRAGFMDDSEMAKLYSGADFFVLPSLYEPFGIALTSAMACETPCIGTNVGGVPEVLGKTGLYCEPRDPSGLADQINRMIEDKKLRDKLGKESRKRAIKMFEWDIIAPQVVKSYSNFLEARK
jgi:glycosyltransferase involved in cell wall biosynthesis